MATKIGSSKRAAAAAARLHLQLVTGRSLKRAGELHLASDRRGLKALSKVNVSAVTLNKRVEDGRVQDEEVVTFYVHRKLPASLIEKGFAIPKTVAGFKTNVVELPPVALASFTPVSSAKFAPEERHRPIGGGLMVGRSDADAGTLALIVRSTDPARPNQLLALGSGHVFTNFGYKKTSTLIQPYAGLGGDTADDVIGRVIACNKFAAGNASNNLFDAAVAELSVPALPGLLGRPALAQGSIRRAVEGDHVKIYAGLSGEVDAVVENDKFPLSWSVKVGSNHLLFGFGPSLLLAVAPGQRLQPGDSGSIVVSADGRHPVGILSAIRGDSYGLASHLDRAAQDLKFEP